MKKYRSFIIFIVIVVGVTFLPIPKNIRLVLLLAVLAVFAFLRRNIFFYLHANKLANGRRPNAAWKWYERSIRSGLSDDGVVSIASLYIQFGNITRGKELLEDFFAHTKRGATDGTRVMATMLRALVVYVQGDTNEALSQFQALQASGYKSPTLIVDLMTMQLDLGMNAQARETYEKSGYSMENGVTLQEAYGRLLIAERNWSDAYLLYDNLMKQNVVMAPGMLHAAQCYIHYGEVKNAILALSLALRASFNHTCLLKREDVQTLLDQLQDPTTRIATARAIDADTDAVSRGSLPKPWPRPCPPSRDDVLEGFALKEKKLGEKVKTDRMPNTEITDADEAYLKAHHLEDV